MPEPVLQPKISLLDVIAARVDFYVTPDIVRGDPKPDVSINHRVGFAKEGGDSFIVMFDVKIAGEDEKKFRLNVSCIAFFETDQPIDRAFQESDMANVNALAIAFPFVRGIVSQFTALAGIPRIILPTLNFATMSKKSGDPSPPQGDPAPPKADPNPPKA